MIAMNSKVDASSITSFTSTGYKVGNVKSMFPPFSGIRIMMMPFYTYDLDSLPTSLDCYKPMFRSMLDLTPSHVESGTGHTAYLTIDEMELAPDQIQRKSGLHVDGMYQDQLAGAWGGGGGGWGSCGNGMLLVSNTSNLCKMWTGEFQGRPIGDGDCQHLQPQLTTKTEFSFQAGDLIWADGLLVHESYPTIELVKRQFVRISLPNNAPWFEGYTANPLGIKPSGQIINKRRI